MEWKGRKMTLTTGDGTDDTDSSADSIDFFRSHNQCNPFQISVISDKGITLVEVLLAVVVLSVGLAGVLRAYAASIGALEVSRETVITIELLKEKMADVEQEMIDQGGFPLEARAAGSTENSRIIIGHGEPHRPRKKAFMN